MTDLTPPQTPPEAVQRRRLIVPLALSAGMVISGFADTGITTQKPLPGTPLIAGGFGLGLLLIGSLITHASRGISPLMPPVIVIGTWLGAAGLKVLPALIVFGPAGLNRAPLAELLIAGALLFTGAAMPRPSRQTQKWLLILCVALLILGVFTLIAQL